MFCTKTKRTILLALFLLLVTSVAPVNAKEGSKENGRLLYMGHCFQCHGEDGEGAGSASEFIPVKPRNFTDGVFKMKTSEPSSPISRDEDIFAAISRGMQPSGMPAWKSTLTESQMWDLVAYVKSLSDMFDDMENPPSIDFSKAPPADEVSVEKGKKAYFDFKCDECHGEDGATPTTKKLKTDSGEIIRPRNLRKPWTYIGTGSRADIYSKILNGIPTTPMPSFTKVGLPEEFVRKSGWDLADYVVSLGDKGRKKRKIMFAIAGLLAILAVSAVYTFSGSKKRKG